MGGMAGSLIRTKFGRSTPLRLVQIRTKRGQNRHQAVSSSGQRLGRSRWVGGRAGAKRPRCARERLRAGWILENPDDFGQKRAFRPEKIRAFEAKFGQKNPDMLGLATRTRIQPPHLFCCQGSSRTSSSTRWFLRLRHAF